MSYISIVAGCVILGVFTAQRLIWLAPTQLGWVFYLANIIGEIGPKRLGSSRLLTDYGLAGVGLFLLIFGGFPGEGVVAVTIGLLVLVVVLQGQERTLLTAVGTRIDSIGANPDSRSRTRGLARGYPSPSTHPLLSITIIGPFIARSPRLLLGTLLVGRRLRLEVVIGNHSLSSAQTSIRIALELPPGISAEGGSEYDVVPLASGEIFRLPIDLVARSESPGGVARLVVEWGGETWSALMSIASVLRTCDVTGASISRYPGGSRSAFAWRGDMDLYDTSTLQSIEGLEVALGLAARYRIPQSVYLSTRLSLDQEAASAWEDHYGISRGSREIPDFIEWIRSEVELRHRADYPFESTKPYLVEIGNHGHLHFGTDMAAATENGWLVRARMGAGRYPWLGAETGSLAEQRDNAQEARRLCELHFGFSPRSWAMPDRTRDEYTPAAMEAAGCEVLSDSDVRTRDNVLFQPRPHFASGTNAVELTKRYPGDPQDIFHHWMNLFWVHRAHRLGIPVVFMCHQHMRLFDGWACTRFTEGILRHVLHAFAGDLWISTVYGVGVYWRDVLSERKTVTVSIENGVVTIRSTASLAYRNVPVDLELEGGERCTLLVDLDPGCEVRLNAGGVL